jgi:3-carboxy-cis,cis-muconate cycloisomerase
VSEPHDVLFTTPAMADVFSSAAHVRQMLLVEAALARASARAGVIPESAADAIAGACRVELYDVRAVLAEGAVAGTPVIPLVRLLGQQVDGDARGWVHWGATSQDVVDTALVLQMRDGLDLLRADLRGVCDAAAALAVRHRHTVMAGRTLLQQALPMTFGLKAARWLALARRQLDALDLLRRDALAVQLGGAAGTLAAFGDRGLDVASNLAAELDLPLPDLPRHAERDRVARVAATLGIVAGAMSKIALDVALLAQTEVGEVAEGSAPGKGGSSAMPQKRNPVDAMSALAAARLAIALVPAVLSGMAQEHERAVGAWQAEWVAIPDLFRHTAGAVAHVRRALEGLEVDADRMRANLDLAGGALMAESLVTALAARVGGAEAREIVRRVSARVAHDRLTLHDAALDDARVSAVLSPDDVARVLDPTRYLGAADALIDRALASRTETT